ncbi:MAG TPA: hypothetical protein VNA14_02365 [Mycobacteriales bacterium]|nr:hypothetical protein [Mycobacteriales bacterium]
MTEIRWCGGCAAEVAFERFDCAEHPEDCLELVCTGCGSGVELIGATVAPSAPAPAVERGAAA